MLIVETEIYVRNIYLVIIQGDCIDEFGYSGLDEVIIFVSIIRLTTCDWFLIIVKLDSFD